MWHQWFNCNFTKLQEYFLCAKKTKIMTLFNNLLPLRHPCANLESITYVINVCTQIRCLRFDLNVNNVSAYIRCLRMYYFQMEQGWRGGRKVLNKVIFVLSAHKKFSRSFVKLRLNHWCHMHYFNDFLTTFLDLFETWKLFRNVLSMELKIS